MTGEERDRPLSDRLDELGEAVVEARQRVRALEVERDKVAAKVADLSEQIIEAHASSDTAAATKLGKERTKAEAQLRDASERVEGASRAVQRAEVERASFAAERVEQLVEERKPDADAAAAAVQDAVGALAHAQKQWDAAQSDLATILRFAGRSSEGLPQFPPALAELTRHARRAGQVDVPSPARR